MESFCALAEFIPTKEVASARVIKKRLAGLVIFFSSASISNIEESGKQSMYQKNAQATMVEAE
jgi:hypothetical protein